MDETCVECSGPLMELGMLGSRAHFRCRNCGLNQSKQIERITTQGPITERLIRAATEAIEIFGDDELEEFQRAHEKETR